MVGKESACNPRALGLILGSGSKGMATHSSILAWEIPWTEQPGGLWSMGSQESDVTEHATATEPSLSDRWLMP